MQSLTSIVQVGEAAEQFIKSNDDVVWSDKTLYHSVYDITPTTYNNEDGTELTYTPPELHCVLA